MILCALLTSAMARETAVDVRGELSVRDSNVSRGEMLVVVLSKDRGGLDDE